MKRTMKNKRGYFFSLDALIALIIILGVVLFIKPDTKQSEYETNVQDDLLKVLSSLQIGEMNDSDVQQWIADGNITKLNQSVLEQIGEFYALASPFTESLAQKILDDLALNENLGIWYETNLIASTNKTEYTNATTILTSRQIISGLLGGKNATSGFASRAFLSSNNTANYFYFGGYVGDGNITARLEGNIISANIEGVFSGNFDIYINNNFIGSYTPSSGVPYLINLNPSLGNFTSGVNNVSFRANTPNSFLYIAGGYIRVVYNNSVPSPTQIKRFLPGIDGYINIYDSFYSPGAILSLNAQLHYNSPQNIFFNIGNTEIYRGNSSGAETTINFNNTFLFSKLIYSNLTKKTIPFRLGLENASYLFNHSAGIDVFSVTDLSGSMGDNCNGCNLNSCTPVGPCAPGMCCGDPNGCKICDAKAANKILINGILNVTENKIGLVGYSTVARDADFYPFSRNNNSLIDFVNLWPIQDTTCICCGINKAASNYFNNLVVYYDLNGTSLDKSIGSNHATFIGTPSYYYDSGINSSVMQFNGSNYLNASNFNGVKGYGTIAFWFKLNQSFNSTSTRTQGLWSKYRDNSNNAYIILKGRDLTRISTLNTHNGSIAVKLEGPFTSGVGTIYINTTTNSWNANTWYHLALTWDESDIKIYVNGVQERGIYYSNPGIAGGLGYIGTNNFGRTQFDGGAEILTPRFLNGSMDDIRVYKRELSSQEIQALALNTTITSAICGNNLTETGEVCDNNKEYCTISGQKGVRNCNSQCNGFENCVRDETYKSMVVLTDGEANRECSQQGTTIDLSGGGGADQPIDDAIQAACDVYNDYGVVVYAVGFDIGYDTSGNITRRGLQNLAVNCGHGTYYNANVNELIDIYTNITEQIIRAAYYEQTIVGAGFTSKLYPDSYIQVSYNATVLPSGLIITSETPIFNNNISNGSFYVPNDASFYEARVVSYSGSRWTSRMRMYNESLPPSWDEFFDLSDYNSSFINLGDPYFVNIPSSNVVHGNNTVWVQTGTSSINTEGGSFYDKIIYSVVKNISSYSPICTSAKGCSWTIEFEDGTNATYKIPSDYIGTINCYYTNATLYNNDNDAISTAVYLLLEKMDLNKNGKIETKFTDQDLMINFEDVSGIPFTWQTEVQTRAWI